MVNPVTEDSRARRRERAAATLLGLVGKLPLPPDDLSARSDTQRVITRLGEHTECGITLASFAARTLSTDVLSDDPCFDWKGYWRHAMDVALTAEFLNRRASSEQDRGTIFAAAILHDVGALILDYLVPKSFARVRWDAQRRCRSVILEEDAELGIDRMRIGACLAKQWRLPPEITDAIRLHRCPPTSIDQRTRHGEVVALIQLADALCCDDRFGGPDRRSVEAQRELGAYLGVDPDIDLSDTREIRAQAATWLDVCSPVLGIAARGRPDPQHAHQDVSSDPTTNRDRFTSIDVRRLTEAVTRFAVQLSPGDTPSDVCASVGHCCSEILQLERAVTFVADCAHTVYHCAITDAGETTVADATELADGSERISEAGAALLTTIVPAPPLADPVRERYRRVFGGGFQWMLPLVHDRKLYGGVLFDSADLPRDTPFGGATTIEMLIALFGSAVAQVDVRVEIDRSIDTDYAVSQRLRDADERSARARSLSTISVMAAGAAHELNTPLAVISGRAQVLARDTHDPIARRALEMIRSQSETCSDILDQLIEYAKPRTPRPVVLVLKPWFDDFLRAWRAGIEGPPPDLEISFADPAIRVFADPDQLRRILEAVLSNAVAALPKEASCLIVNSPSTESDETVVIAVEDNGHGMASDVLERACDPFFSHRGAGRGRGLGLCIAQRLAEVNEGRLWLESRPSAGTTAYIELPSADFAGRL